MAKKRFLFVPFILLGTILTSCEHVHSFDIYNHNSEFHWKECECGLKQEEDYRYHYHVFNESENEKYKKSSTYNPNYEIKVCQCGDVISTFKPITSENRKKALECNYTFNPKDVLIKEKTEYDYSSNALQTLTETFEREGHHLIYYFEGSAHESSGFNRDVQHFYAYFYLWDDGLYLANVTGNYIRGYWYNSSLTNGFDENHQDIKDCLELVSNVEYYESISFCQITNGFTAFVGIKVNSEKINRSMIINGSYYYPDVAIEIYFGQEMPPFIKGWEFYDLQLYRVDKDLRASKIENPEEYEIIFPEDFYLEGRRILAQPGIYEIKATYHNLETTSKIEVVLPW